MQGRQDDNLDGRLGHVAEDGPGHACYCFVIRVQPVPDAMGERVVVHPEFDVLALHLERQVIPGLGRCTREQHSRGHTSNPSSCASSRAAGRSSPLALDDVS
jgi:hypothetical protein